MRLLVSLWKMFCYTAGTAFIGLAVYEFWFLAKILYWVEHNPATTRVMDARLEALRPNQPKVLEQKWTEYEGISIHLKRAIIIAEDAKFVDHEGFDWEGIQRAMDRNQRRGKFVAGGSTITQQLAKNLFLSGERSLLRKGQEAILAAMLEASMDKRRIFEIYLNVAEWGENVFGAEDVFAPFHDVQIDLENAALVHDGLEHRGKNRLLALAQQTALSRKEQVLCELL